MSRYADRARFHADDPVELVQASVACPFCLGSDGVRWRFRPQGARPVVRCFCADCRQDWDVLLTAQQALRLGLMETLDRLVC
jgi:hypothetical protein